MSLSNPTAILFDINGNPVMVSGGMVLPVGTLGQLQAAVDSNGLVQYLQTVSGSLQITGKVWNGGGPVGVSASINLPVWQTGPVGITASVPLQVWEAGTVGVSGSVTVSGQVSVNNFPATQNVSGSVFVSTTGSAGMQVGNAPYDPLWITTTGSIPVTFAGLPQLSINNFPATQNVSGTVGAVIQNWPAIIGVSGTVTLDSQVSVNNFPAVQAVSGTVTIGTFPVMAVTGTYQSGSTATAPIYPVLFGGVDQNNVVRPLRTDPQGRLINQTTGSTVTSVNSSTSNQTLLAANPNRVGAIIYLDGTNKLYLKFGITASTTDFTVQVGGNGYYEVPFSYTGRIDCVFSTNAAANVARVTELF